MLKKVCVSGVKVSQRLLQSNGIHLFKKCVVHILLERCQHSRSLFVATLLTTFESVFPHSKTLIINEPAATESTVNQILLLSAWVDSKFYALLKYQCYFTIFKQKFDSVMPYIPIAKARGTPVVEQTGYDPVISASQTLRDTNFATAR